MAKQKIEKLKSNKKSNTKRVFFTLFIILIFISSQVFIVYLILDTSKQYARALNETETSLNSQILFNNKDVQNKISSLTGRVTYISDEQNSLQDELGAVKAKTSADFSSIIEKEIKGVVTIKTDVSQGTGFLITSDGFVVTNNHVLSGASFANIHTYDGEIYSAEDIGSDVLMDIYILKISGSFSNLDIGDSDDVKVGEKVLAIGNPLGLSFTATEGIISARDREGINGLPYYFQTDVSLNPGNSGGPLINTDGDVIAINNFKISGADSLGFALEINSAKETINKITLEAIDEEIL